MAEEMQGETAPDRLTRTAAVVKKANLSSPDDDSTIAAKMATSLQIARQYADDSDQDTGGTAGWVPFRLQRRVNEGENVFHVLDGVYLGSEYGAADISLLRGLGISRVINITSGDRRVPNFGIEVPEWDVEYSHYELSDFIGADPTTAMEEGVRNITTWVGEARKVLVHCSAGLSRSTTVVMAWLMSTHGMTLKDAVSTVTVGRGRPPCCNASFWYKLAALERKLFSLADDAAPSHCFLDHVVEDLGTGSGGLGLDEVEVRRLMPLRQWNAYAVLNEIMGSD